VAFLSGFLRAAKRVFCWSQIGMDAGSGLDSNVQRGQQDGTRAAAVSVERDGEM